MPNVKVFSTPTCPYCIKVKEFLKNNNIEFADLNVATNDSAREEMIDKSGQMGVPVVEINNKIITGFDQEAITKALNL